MGPADVPRHLHGPRPHPWWSRRVPHDGAQRRPAARLLHILEADPPRRLVFHDGFANDDGTPNLDLPGTSARVTIEAIDGGRTRMSIESRFPSIAAMEQILAMGMEEGLTQAVGQIDAILAANSVHSA